MALTLHHEPLHQVSRDPYRDPQVGDCLKKYGAGHKPTYRFVTLREGTKVGFVTGPNSGAREIWLSSWQEWSSGADLEHATGDEEPMPDFFIRVAKRDTASRKRPD